MHGGDDDVTALAITFIRRMFQSNAVKGVSNPESVEVFCTRFV